MFPFTNYLFTFHFTGKELLDTLALVQEGSKGYYPTYGLKQLMAVTKTGSKKFLAARLANGS